MKNSNIIIDMYTMATRYPEKTALVDHGESSRKGISYEHITYRQLFNDVMATAANLRKCGFKKGDRIVVFVPMSYPLYVLCLAIAYMGAVSVFIDAWADRDRLSKACRVVSPKGFIGTRGAQVLRVNRDIRNIPVKKTVSAVVSLHNEDQGEFAPEVVSPHDEALITLTTGTTGLPKGARRTHGALSEQFSVLNGHLDINESDTDLTALPIFVFLNISTGSTSVLPLFNPAKPSSFDPAKVVEQVRELNITTSIGSPVFYEKMADYLIGKGETLTLKAIYTGGAPVFRPLAEKMLKAFPGTEIEIVYGCTEAEPISAISLHESMELAAVPGMPVGKKVDGIDVKIIRASTAVIQPGEDQSIDDYLAPASEVGEIVVKGPHVLQEYLGDPELFAKNKIKDGDDTWHRTGDAGVMDREGNIFIHGRVAKRLVNRGVNMYPVPFEQQLMEIEGVSFSSVVEKGEKVFAVIEADVSQHEKSNILTIAYEKLRRLEPDQVIFLKKIPRDPRHNSKVDYEKLSALL